MADIVERVSGYHEFVRVAELLVDTAAERDSDLLARHPVTEHAVRGLERFKDDCLVYDLSELALNGLADNFKIQSLHINLGPKRTAPLDEKQSGYLILSGNYGDDEPALTMQQFRLFAPYRVFERYGDSTRWGLISADGPSHNPDLESTNIEVHSLKILNEDGIKTLGGLMIEASRHVWGIDPHA